MSNELTVSETVEKVTDFISKQEDSFVRLNENCLNRLDFIKEAEFAKQLLMANGYLLDTARMNPDSLHAAISNVAAIGITLNPANKYAYLVPRKVKGQLQVCLDVSYRGLIKLATDTGVIKFVKAEIVHENDNFKYNGFHVLPEFSADVFGDRGEVVGVYALAITVDGDPLVETMTISAINKIRDDSEAYKAALKKGENSWDYQNNVWVKFDGEMRKKTVIKRAFKTLPPSKGTEFVLKAIEVVNHHEGIDFDKPKELIEITYTDEELKEYQRCIDEGDYFNLFSLKNSLDPEAQMTLHRLCMPEAEKGKKGAQNNKFAQDMKEAANQVESSLNELRISLDSDDDVNIMEILGDCSQCTKDYFLSQLTGEQQQIINTME